MIGDGFLLSPPEAYELLGSVYGSTDAFATDFAEEYPSADALRAHLAALSTRPGSLFLVAREEAEKLGYLLVEPRLQRKLRHTAELNMGVRAAARGRGVGAALLGEALAHLRREGVIEILYLMVRADNAAALRLYERAGFETVATLEHDTKIGLCYFDGVLMRKVI